ncbi:DUF6731 family protein [Acinetobacter brisouii]|uniref:DUF6731 family protein n=1 Tax=Acinetobacter brisouii TaxID=396323 RepID=UPI00061EC7D6|nr:DUF6731 family protein [Acinetobacter brisouii]KJV39741.1 hypothetical protein VH98_04465 [Acinetobacter brisouii]
MAKYNPLLTIELYKVNKFEHKQPLEKVFEIIEKDSLDQRSRLVNQVSIRLDKLIQPTEDKPYWLLNFSRILNVAPGQRGNDDQITDIELEEGHDFAEETAVLYIPQSEFILIQYAHHGPRVSAINEYLNTYIQDMNDAPKQYEFLVQLKPDAEARLDNKDTLTELEIRINPNQMTAAMRQEGKTLAEAIETVGKLNPKSVYLKISAKPEDSLVQTGVKKFLKMIAREGVASTVRATGLDDNSEKPETVDLIKDKEKKTFQNVPLSPNKRWSEAVRYEHLEKAYTGWNKILSGSQ